MPCAQVYNGSLWGLSTIHRDGSTSFDLADGHTAKLTAHLRVDGLRAHFDTEARVTFVTVHAETTADIDYLDVYLEATMDLTPGSKLKLDDFRVKL